LDSTPKTTQDHPLSDGVVGGIFDAFWGGPGKRGGFDAHGGQKGASV